MCWYVSVMACTVISRLWNVLLLIIFVYLTWALLNEGGRKQACSGFLLLIHHINISDSDRVIYHSLHPHPMATVPTFVG